MVVHSPYLWIFIMRLLIAFIFPFLTFFTIGRPLAGICCFVLQITILGWIPATIWAVFALNQYKTDKKIQRMQDSISNANQNSEA